MPRSIPMAALLALAAHPAGAASTFVNRSEYLVCLVPDPDHLPPAGLRVTPGPGCVPREEGDGDAAVTAREATRASSPTTSPIALKRLAPAWDRTVLFLEPGGSVSFAADQAGSARFTVGSPERLPLGEIRIEREPLALVVQAEQRPDGGLSERLDGLALAPGGSAYAFRPVDGETPGLELVDRPEPSACAIL